MAWWRQFGSHRYKLFFFTWWKNQYSLFLMILNSMLFIFFNWRIIALKYGVGFCRMSTWISHRYAYVPSLLNLTPTPSHPSCCSVAKSCLTLWDPWTSRLSPSTSLSSLSNTANSHWLSILRAVVYMFPSYCLHSFHPLLLWAVTTSLYFMSESPWLPCK